MSNHSQTKIIRSTVESRGHTLFVDHPASLAQRPGPVYMFIHGIALSSAFWAPLMSARFRDSAAWISVSLPVHAPSFGPRNFAPEDVSGDLLNSLNGEVLNRIVPGREVIPVGHSTGGFAALCLALAQPERVMGLVIVGGFADGHWSGLEGDMQMMARKEKLGSFGPPLLRASSWLTTRWPWLHSRAAAMFAYDKRAFLTDRPTGKALQAIRQDARWQNKAQLLAFFSGIRDVDIWNQVGRIRQPVLVVSGQYDPVIPRTQTIRLDKELCNSRLLLYSNVGHMVMNERRNEFWRDLLAWQKEHFPETKQ